MDCVKGKLITRARKRKRSRKESTLKLIYIDMCGSISPSAIGGFKYLITFIDDHSRFIWIKLLSKKFKALDAFKKFKATIEVKLGNLIKCVHSNKSGEFYG